MRACGMDLRMKFSLDLVCACGPILGKYQGYYRDYPAFSDFRAGFFDKIELKTRGSLHIAEFVSSSIMFTKQNPLLLISSFNKRLN